MAALVVAQVVDGSFHKHDKGAKAAPLTLFSNVSGVGQFDRVANWPCHIGRWKFFANRNIAILFVHVPCLGTSDRRWVTLAVTQTVEGALAYPGLCTENS